MAKNAVNKAEAKATPLAVVGDSSIPSFMQGMAGMGTESVDRSTLAPPRLILTQPLSPMVMEGKCGPGEWWLTSEERSLGKSVECIPVYLSEDYIIWRAREDGGGVAARQQGAVWVPSNSDIEIVNKKKQRITVNTGSSVASSGLTRWGTSDPTDENSPPVATLLYNVLVYVPGVGKAVVSMSKSGQKVGRKLFSRLASLSLPVFGQKFILAQTLEKSDDGIFFVPSWTPNGLVSDEALFMELKGEYERFHASIAKGAAQMITTEEPEAHHDDLGDEKVPF